MSQRNTSAPIMVVFAVSIGVFCPAANAEERGFPLADMIRETKVALLRVQEKGEARNLPPLSSAVLELNTIQEVDAKGSVKFLVVEVGGGPATEATSTVKITLRPPSQGARNEVTTDQLADRLAEGILASARSLSEAALGQPALQVSAVTVAMKFAVTRSVNGGLSVEFPPFQLSAGGGVKASEIQVVTVTYAANSEK
jgi:NTP-dependent ternary system trypsin peptidase co-occuring protein